MVESQHIFLWLDSFDPHEPWDPPPEFDRYTDPAYKGRRLIIPMGGPASEWASADEIRHIQGVYAGEAASVDFALGQLFETLERLGYSADSIVRLLADHGHPLADHGTFLKGTDRPYNELLRVPFLLRLPCGRRGGTRADAMVQYHDVLPTLLDLMGLQGETHETHGRSFRAVVEGDTPTFRETCITGYHAGVDRVIRRQEPGNGSNGRTSREWSLILRPEGEPDELYDVSADVREQRNLIDE